MSQLGVGILGTGWAGEKYIRAFRATGAGAVRAVCSRSLDNVERLARETGLDGDVLLTTDYQALLDSPDVDIVVIGTPNHLHPEQVEAAAGVGKHILLEKPAALDREGFERCITAVDTAGVQASVGLVLRWASRYRRAKELIESRTLGAPFYLEAGYDNHYSLERLSDRAWMLDPAQVGDALLSAGIHAVDLLAWLAGEGDDAARPVEVHAMNRKGRKDLPYDDFSVALVRFENGAIGKVHTHFSARGPLQVPVTVYGDGGTLREGKLWREGAHEWQDLQLDSISAEGLDVMFERHVSEFARSLQEGRHVPVSLQSTVASHEICFAASESARTGKPVRMERGELIG